MNAPANPLGTGVSLAPDDLLDSWKAIAAYLNRDIRTVQRWERYEGMPVRRHRHMKKPTVYAYRSELDAWFRERQPQDDPAADAAFEPEPESEPDNGEAVETARQALEQAVTKPTPAERTVTVVISGAWKRRVVIVLITAVFAVGGFGAYELTSRKWLAPPAKKVRLVVLPFTNLSGNPEQDYFSAGLTDELTTQLGRTNPAQLGVIAATSSKIAAGKTTEEISRMLSVQYVLEGSVRREGNQVRIDVQLIDAKDQTHIWADSFTRDVSDILRVQSEVASLVARRIEVALPVAAPRPPAVNPAAHDEYLRGRFYLTNRDLAKSIQSFEEALKKDPNYAQAYAGLASVYVLLGQVPNDAISPNQAKPRAREAAQHALQLDPQIAEAHAVLGNVYLGYDWNLAEAEMEYRQAIELNPNDPTSHEWYGHLLMVEGRNEEALSEVRHSLELDPVSPLFNTVLAEGYYYSRQYDQAIEQARRCLERNPNFWYASIWLGSALREKKMYAEAVAEFSRARASSGDNPAVLALYGHAQALAGNAAGAREVLKILQKMQQSRFVSALYPAAIYLGLGDKNQTLKLLDEAYNQRIDRLIYFGVDPIADPLRSDPRFAHLLQKIGLPAKAAGS